MEEVIDVVENDVSAKNAVAYVEKEQIKNELSAEKQDSSKLEVQLSHNSNFRDSFAESYKIAKVLCKAKIIPVAYQDNVEDTTVAVDMASRMGVSPMMVMQNLYVVKGKPSWSGQACMTFLRNKYKKVKVIYVGAKGTDERGCYIKAIDEDGDVLEGTTITIAMAKAEGWWSKKDKYGKETSKWQTMPEQMLAYRAAAFFARVYCPELLMGCQIEGEAEDIAPEPTARVVDDVL
jgi:hypothetical protein